MVFSSLLFLFRFLPIVLLAYYILPKKCRNFVLFLSSLVFYAWGEPVYVVLILLSTCVDYTAGLAVHYFKEKGKMSGAKVMVACSAVINLALLGFFKYAGFFLQIVHQLTGLAMPELHLALPIGISFYTFQTMSYTIDVYRGDAKMQKNFITFGAYVAYEGGFPTMHLDAKKKVVAYRGLNTVTFHTKRIFKGRTGLQKLIAENPYRVYMMLGMNEIHYRPASQMISEYKDMIEAIQQADPNTDIVLCAVSPVTRAEKARHPGMKQIPIFNRRLKKLAKKMGLKYLDYTDFLKDSGGFLKAGYATGDGYHWKPPAYAKFGTVIGKYDKSLDQ